MTFVQCYPDPTHPESIIDFALRAHGLRVVNIRYDHIDGFTKADGEALKDGATVILDWKLLSEQYAATIPQWRPLPCLRPSCSNPEES
jgi:hypothetical protein